ncbi:2Fe-2S iron-sulfur cluster-binding protein [Hydrogenophaga sp. 5NK40-0174]|uniref:2Fe-2S iron-sulfur cluster-binding protein n=1 Tax=Hydrogenophaga sp. 5NK40-0174 TaxID=3127649 RepID=UPI0031091D29
MIDIVFIDHLQQATTVQAEPGVSLMQAAVDNQIVGVVGECGGSCSCATCVCGVDPAWADRLTPPDALESAMLESAAFSHPNSRLCCQITLREDHHGLTVHLPESQF